MLTENQSLMIIGAGLAGCEAAWAAAQRDISVKLYEMRPLKMTAAHRTDGLAELVCSNSLGSALPDKAPGLLRAEMQMLDSLLMKIADECRVPAGSALAVDRSLFSIKVNEAIESHPRIELIRKEITEIPRDQVVIVASGPLTSDALAADLSKLIGEEHLYFFDALAPIIEGDSIDQKIAFAGSRYNRGVTEKGDYLNCPFTREEYEAFVSALLTAETIPLKPFEEAIRSGVKAGKGLFFEGCLPIEILAARGMDALAFGPLRPIGLTDPRTGRRPWAVLQLRLEDNFASAYNMVGFQTNLRYPEQDRVFRLIPGLAEASFLRYGQMHRNSYINAPAQLNQFLQLKSHPNVFIAGQLSGIEGYMGNIASGLMSGMNAASYLKREPYLQLPEETMIASLIRSITSADPESFQPIKANMGILPALKELVKQKTDRAHKLSQRSLIALKTFLLKNSAKMDPVEQ